MSDSKLSAMVVPRCGAFRCLMTAGTAALLILGLAGAREAAGKDARGAGVRNRVPDVRLKDTTGKSWSASMLQSRKAVVYVFLGTQCPVANSYAEPLSRIALKYRDQGIQFFGVNANREEDLKAVTRHAREYRFVFPVLKDEKQELADALGARVTPEAFVLDAERNLRYRGRIDDGYASRTRKRPEPTSRDLEAALDALLAGTPVAVPVTQALGCAIARPERKSASSAKVSYHRDVAPILQARCQSCHRPGQIGPFPLMTYADARNWAAEIKEFTASRQMPPWKAEPGHGDFLDSRRLSDEELATLAAWVDAGAPEGSSRRAPAAKEWTEGWMLGQPDLVLSMPEEFHVAATGSDVFHCFVLPTNLTEDRQVVGVEIRAGNARVLHHVLNFIDTSGQARRLDEQHPGPGYSSGPGGVGFFPSGALGGWAPGNMPRFLPKGVYRPLPKGADLVMQVHYHKTGKPETDRTSVGIYFAKEPVEKQARTLPLTNLLISIPPGAERHEVRAQMRTPADLQAFAITPHMHLLGKEMRVTATLPDGAKRDLIWIRDWDYRWQDTYLYREPVPLPRGTLLELTAYYDNSTKNPLNPNNPPRQVRFGEQTTDEMCFAFIEFTLDTEPPGLLRRLLGR